MKKLRSIVVGIFLVLAAAVPAVASVSFVNYGYISEEYYGTTNSTYDPSAITSGDFNGDGKIDLAAVIDDEGKANKVSIFIGNGSGGFSRTAVYSINRPRSITSGDFNGDGKADLAVVGGNGVTILVSNGDGTFLINTTYYIGGGAITSRDFNGDGKMDLAVAGWGFSILLGNGDGTFQSKSGYGIGDGSTSIATGDFNGDGEIDIALPSAYWSEVYTFLGNGDGTFSANGSFSIGYGHYGIAAGDFNGDGKTDLAVPNYWYYSVSILLANSDGTGTFQEIGSYGTPERPYAVAVGDFDADGNVDLATANSYYWLTGSVSAFSGNGDGTFQSNGSYGVLSGAQSIIAEDINADGRIDIAAESRYVYHIAILISNHPPIASAGADQIIEAANPSGAAITLDGSGSDEDGDSLTFTWTWGENNTVNGTNPTISLPLGTTEVTLTVNDGISSSTDIVNITIQDTTPPTGAIIINNGAVSTNSTSVALSISALDIATGVSQMCVSNTLACSAWEPYATSKSWTLVNTEDLMTVYIQFIDNAGNISMVYSDSIYMDSDGDGWWNSQDCDPNNSSIYPGAPEVKSDGIDQDCNGYDLTIYITSSTYNAKRKILTVEATSALNASANLQLVDYGPMTWQGSLTNGKWTITKTGVSNPGAVTVSGVEGSVSSTVTVK